MLHTYRTCDSIFLKCQYLIALICIFLCRQEIVAFKGLWVARLTRNVEVLLPVSLSKKKLHPYCLVLVSSRNRFERDFTIELK